MVGIDVAVASSATLIFRGLSFWLPMRPDSGGPTACWLHPGLRDGVGRAAMWAMSDDFVLRLSLHELAIVVCYYHRPGRQRRRAKTSLRRRQVACVVNQSCTA